MSKKIPVVIYGTVNERIEVGEAIVTQQGNHFFISAKITDPVIAGQFDINPKEFSISHRPLSRLLDDFDVDRNKHVYLREVIPGEENMTVADSNLTKFIAEAYDPEKRTTKEN